MNFICVGKVGQDIFLQGDILKPRSEAGVLYEHIRLGEKFYLEDATISTGGNAPNAAVTLARQGHQVALVSSIGDDAVGSSILAALDEEHIDLSMIENINSGKSSFSTILLAPTGERTILDYPGTVKLSDSVLNFNFEGFDWLYVSSIGSMDLIKKLMQAAHSSGVKIAFNPSSFELKYLDESADLLQYVSLFAVNKEEAAKFVDGANIQDLAVNLSRKVEYVLVSDGPRGSVATDGMTIVEAGLYEDVKVVDRTGAGDAFTSGFVERIASGSSLEQAVTFASANSTGVVQYIGSTTGVLNTGSALHEMDLTVTRI